MVTTALTSLRGAKKCLHIFSDIFTTSIPSHTAIQNWILQYGLHEFTSPIPKRLDWIYILDHTIEFGPQKCLVILGITKEELMIKDGPVTFQQLRVLAIEISRKANSEQIKHSLNKLIKKTGVPAQMVSDHGTDIKKAVEDTQKQHSTIKITYDITHKCGAEMKIIRFIEKRQEDVIEKILRHCGLWKDKIPRSPPKTEKPPPEKYDEPRCDYTFFDNLCA